MEYVRQTITKHGFAFGIPVVIDGSRIFEADYTTANVPIITNKSNLLITRRFCFYFFHIGIRYDVTRLYRKRAISIFIQSKT